MTVLPRLATSMFNVEAVRGDFPMLGQRVHGKPFTFLDSAASAQKPRCVIDRVRRAYEAEYATVHRGLYTFSADMTEAYEKARATVAGFIGAPSPREVVFVRGATEAINLVAASWGGAHLRPGDDIVLSTMEHHSNIVPWQLLRARTGIAIKVAPITDEGGLDWKAFIALLGPRTRLVALTHMSNVLGTLVDIKRAAEAAHRVGAKLLVDGCQAAPRLALDMRALDCDFYVFSGHKVYGPTGIGVLWAREEILKSMPPYQGGGSMIEEVTFEETTFLDPPLRFEAGTPHFIGAVGLASALDYLYGLGLDAVHAHEADLIAYAHERLRGVNALTLHGAAPDKGAILSFSMAGVHPHDIATILDREGIAIRAGHHCAQPLMRRLGVTATARASFGVYNTRDEVDRLAAGLAKVKDIFR
ncbi:MAG: cysteine desulfurase [Pseudomonadota bacterium]